MSASELQEIALDIATEVNRLNRLESQMRLVQAEMLTNPALADICAESLALKLHNFYTGCERIFGSSVCVMQWRGVIRDGTLI
ncbi:hypothetical protein [Microcystis aeruginosa]|nr:hypothetical protein [Microcystis aeruginosa]